MPIAGVNSTGYSAHDKNLMEEQIHDARVMDLILF